MTYTIVGVTGHIDHGKTTLVRVLTGVDTDTAPEEKRGGITIDLGFAAFQVGEHRFAMIDAPGHQKYIGNLLAGVSAIDIGLLIVACDQGIQRQTLEHAAVVRALGVRKLIVVISRVDLASKATVAELSEELELFLADFGFREIPIIGISALTGEGIDQLKSLMCESAGRCAARNNASHSEISMDFRLPVDRVFGVPGRGLVVAGTVWHGELRVGDMLELAGSGELFRVRGLEIHGESIEQSQPGFRTAVNLVGGNSVQITRGDELVAPGTYPTCDQFVVDLELFPDAKEIRSPATVQLHTATQCSASRIVGFHRIAAGSRAVVVVEVERPIVVTYSQACLFRRPYPIGSLAGGRVLAANFRGRAKTKHLIELGRRLQDAEPVERLAAWVDFIKEMDEDAPWFATQAGISRVDFDATVLQAVELGLIIKLDNRLVSVGGAERARRFILKIVEERTRSASDAWLVEDSIVQRARSVGSAKLITWVIGRLVAENRLVRLNNLIAIASEKTVLSKKQRANMVQIIAMFADTRSPPTLKEVASQLQMPSDAVNSLLRFATQQRLLVNLGRGFQISTQVFLEMCQELRSLFRAESSLSVAMIRDHWRVTRKHAIPLLEYCDREGITVRKQDLRFAGPNLDQACGSQPKTEQGLGQD